MIRSPQGTPRAFDRLKTGVMQDRAQSARRTRLPVALPLFLRCGRVRGCVARCRPADERSQIIRVLDVYRAGTLAIGVGNELVQKIRA